MAGVEVDMFTETSNSLSLLEQENRTHEYRSDLWGYAVHTQSDTCISFINTFYHQVEWKPFLSSEWSIQLTFSDISNSHNHQLTCLRLEEINILVAWIEMMGSKFWATKADFIYFECSRNFLLHLILYDRASNSLLSVIKNGRALVLGAGILVGLRQFEEQSRRFVTLNCYLRKPLLESAFINPHGVLACGRQKERHSCNLNLLGPHKHLTPDRALCFVVRYAAVIR